MIRDAIFSGLVGALIGFIPSKHSRATCIMSALLVAFICFAVQRLMAYIADGPLFSP